MRIILKLATLFTLCCSYSFAAEQNYCAESRPDGIAIEAEKKRLVSVARVPVKFSDSSGFRKARVIGQERAKGEILRFFEQNQTTIRKVESQDSDKESATQTTDSQGILQSKTYTREQADLLKEVETSIASGDLTGISQVEEHFDSSTQELCVAMGFSAKSAQSSIDAREWMKGEAAMQPAPGGDKSSYTRKAPDDW